MRVFIMVNIYVLSNSNFVFDKLVFNDVIEFFYWRLKNGVYLIDDELFFKNIKGYNKKVGVVYYL